jgi:hypothetical protein
MALRFKPKDQLVRMVLSDDPAGVMPEHRGKVFAVIGPFDGHTDKQDLQDMLETLLRGFNLERDTHS